LADCLSKLPRPAPSNPTIDDRTAKESNIMIENINFRTGIGASILRAAQAASIEISQKVHAASRRSRSSRSQVATRILERDRGLINAKLLGIDAQTWIAGADLEFNPRQWLLLGNPQLANLVTETIGDRWIDHLDHLQQLLPLAEDPLLQSRWRAVKQVNKQALASYLERAQGVKVNVSSLFDLQLQPIVEDQRQLLNILHIITLFNQIKQQPGINILPRTFIFGNLGELEPIPQSGGHANGSNLDRDGQSPPNPNREIISLIQSLAQVLARDPDVNGKLQVVYVPNSAGLSSQMYAAADLTQEIAAAAIEDVDLSKIKAAVNGVLSIGSLGKTNYWLQQSVGEQNYFCFGLPIPEIALFKEYGYDPYNYYKHYPEIRQAVDGLLTGYFTPDHPTLCQSLIDTLFGTDDRMILADYIFYITCQARVSATYRQQSLWTKMSILNVAGVG
jgi:glycogen phosphorylase